MPPSNQPSRSTASAPAAGPAPSAEPRTLEVVATKTGFYGNGRKRPGARFSITLQPGEKLPSWVQEVSDADTAPAPDPAAASSAGASSSSVI